MAEHNNEINTINNYVLLLGEGKDLIEEELM